MLRERLKELFNNYDSALRQVIYEVGDVEQKYISLKKPRGVMGDIDKIITRIAEEQLEQSGGGGENHQ